MGGIQQAQHDAHKARLARMGGLRTPTVPIFRQAEISQIKAIPFNPAPLEHYWRTMWFGDLVFGEPRPEHITIEAVQNAVARHFKMSVGVLISRCQSYTVAHPRQIGMYLARVHTREGSTEIARRFGRDCHTTALHAIRKVQQNVAERGDMAADVHAIEVSLGV